MANSAPVEQKGAVVTLSEDIRHEEVKRLVLGANQEDCYLDRLNDSLESFHKQLLEMQVNASNGCLWW